MILPTTKGAGWASLLNGMFSEKPSTQLITKTFKPLEEQTVGVLKNFWSGLDNKNSFFQQMIDSQPGVTLDSLKKSSQFGALFDAVGEEQAMLMDYNQVITAVSTG